MPQHPAFRGRMTSWAKCLAGFHFLEGTNRVEKDFALPADLGGPGQDEFGQKLYTVEKPDPGKAGLVFRIQDGFEVPQGIGTRAHIDHHRKRTF
jgi:hypothetical protein